MVFSLVSINFLYGCLSFPFLSSYLLEFVFFLDKLNRKAWRIFFFTPTFKISFISTWHFSLSDSSSFWCFFLLPFIWHCFLFPCSVKSVFFFLTHSTTSFQVGPYLLPVSLSFLLLNKSFSLWSFPLSTSYPLSSSFKLSNMPSSLCVCVCMCDFLLPFFQFFYFYLVLQGEEQFGTFYFF